MASNPAQIPASLEHYRCTNLLRDHLKNEDVFDFGDIEQGSQERRRQQHPPPPNRNKTKQCILPVGT
jgi:hypothetical protein